MKKFVHIILTEDEARIYLNRGENFEEAISFVKKGINLKPEKKDLPLGRFFLGNKALSSEYARKGKNSCGPTQNDIVLFFLRGASFL